MEYVIGSDPWPRSHRDVIQHYNQQYDASIASGEFDPFVYPYGAYGAFLVIAYLLIPHPNRPWLRKCRFLVWGVLLAFAAYSIRYQRARGAAPALGLGLVHAWSVVYLASILVCNDAQTDFQRIERTEGAFGSDPASHKRKEEEEQSSREPRNSNGHIPPNSTAGPRDRHGEFAWQPYPLTPFVERVDWVCDLFCNFRGAGWNWRTSALPPPPKWLQEQLHRNSGDVPKHSSRIHAGQVKTYPDRRTLLLANAKTLIKGCLVLDALKTLMMHDPYFWGLISRPPPPYFPFTLLTQHWMVHAYRLLVSMLTVKYALQTIFALAPLVFAGLLGRFIGARAEPWIYPETWGSFAVVLDRGLAGWWSSWWHQTFRFAFSAPARRICVVLGLDAASLTAKAVQLVTAFALSGLLHACGTYTAAGPTRPLSNAFSFFLLQAVGIFLEMAISGALGKTGVQKHVPRWAMRGWTFVYVHVWFYYTAHLLCDDFALGGVWLFEPVPVSLFRGLGLGATREDGWWCWGGQIVTWHTGKHWWQSGLAF
ncbi:hypothetical protein EKO04_007053 [Ascochyta lentis]|uniref:Wax synthase domain-containing protein n=1 Tax=Ascochyta lentis TaxID=205686 RepID=A0A8H7J2Q6_9PLEO|nr:hypothetical protein EKO04_007053 [Ascochyta lentis]